MFPDRGNILLIFFPVVIAVPFFLLAILAAVSGVHLYRVAVRGRYLILTGAVLHVERTAILRRPKAVLTELDGKALRVILRSRRRAPVEGGRITFYVEDSTPIYEWRGMHLLGSYLAVLTAPATGDR